MIDWLKYSRLKLRSDDSYCFIKGPNVNKARPCSIRLGDCIVDLDLPPHQLVRFGSHKLTQPADSKQLERIKQYSKGVLQKDTWGYRDFLFRNWVFVGPWFTGTKAELSLSGSILGRSKGHHFPNTSLFHPKAFEVAIADYLDSRYGFHQSFNGGADYRAPVNWKRLSNLSVPAAAFDVYNVDDDGSLHSPERQVIFPISRNRIAKLSFNTIILSKETSGKANFDTTPIHVLQDSIISSLHVKTESDAALEIERVNRDDPETLLSNDFPPLRWPTTDDDTPKSPEKSAYLKSPNAGLA